MPKLPSSQDFQYGSPSPSRGVSGINLSAAGEAASSLGQTLGKYHDVEAEKQSKSEIAIARNNFLRKDLELKDQISQSNKYNEYESMYGNKIQDARNESLAMISDPVVRESFASDLDNDIIRGQHSIRTEAYSGRQRQDQALTMEIVDDTSKRLSGIQSKAVRSRLLQSTNEAINASIGLDPVQKQTLAKNFNDNAREVMFASLAPEQKLRAISGESPPIMDSFEAALPLLQKVEGGYNPVDGNTGKPSLYGISQKWHPEEFDKVNALYQAGKISEAQAESSAFYKKEFWDKNKIGSLPPETRAIVFDAFVNHRQDFAKELYKDAENGATPGGLLEKRRAEYDRLSQSPEYAANHDGWMDRIATVADATGVNPEGRDLFLGLPADKQESLRKDAIEQMQIQSDTDRVSKAINGDGYIDSSDKDQMKIYDSYFRDTVIPQTEGMDIYDRNAFIAKQIANAGVVPKSVLADAVGKIRTGSDQEVIAASDLYLQLQTVAPELSSSVNKKDLSIAVQVSQSIASGIPASEAVKLARQSIEIENKPVYEERKKYIKENRDDVQKSAEGFFHSWIPFVGSDVDINSQQGSSLIADYKQAYNQMYLRSGDEDVSSEFAKRIVGGKYSQSQFNNGTIMQYAPERYYSIPNKDTEWMTQDFLDWRKTNFPTFNSDESEKYYIQPDERTSREAAMIGQNGEPPTPTYRVVYFDKKTGLFDTLEKRYSPDKKKAISGAYDEAIAKRKLLGQSSKAKSPISGAYNNAKVGASQ